MEKPWEVEDKEQLSDFTEDDLAKPKDVARVFRKKTGIGADRWHP